MEPECGTPAFDNIDDVLAERIVNHSRTHSDRTEPPSENEKTPTQSPEDDSGSSGFPAGVLIAGMIMLTLAVFLYTIVHRHSRR